MSIDKYRQNWRAIKDRKDAIDEHLAGFRKTAKPIIDIDAIIFVLIVIVSASTAFYLIGYADGKEVASAEGATSTVVLERD